jgi:hypothetical protein
MDRPTTPVGETFLSVAGVACRYYLWTEGGIKLKNRIRRITDILEKLGVAGSAIGFFRENTTGRWWGIGCLLLSLILTKEDS